MSAVQPLMGWMALRLLYAGILTMWAFDCVAYSSTGANLARVRQKGELPCFAIPRRWETVIYSTQLTSISVRKISAPAEQLMWEIEATFVKPKQFSEVYIKPGQCIPYGSVPKGMTTLIDAQPLQIGVKYWVHISADSTNPRSSLSGGYTKSFCLFMDKTNAVKVKELDERDCPRP